MKRREFIAASLAVGATATSVGQAHAGSKTDSKAALRLSCQEWVVEGDSLSAKVDKLARWGFEGLEISGKGLSGRVGEYKKVLKGTGVKVSGICSGYEGVLGHHDPAIRRKAIDSMKEILKPAGELNSTGLIFVPAFNHHKSTLTTWEIRELLLDVLPELAETAHQAGTRMLLEPLNRKETIYVRLLADAAAIARDVNHPGFAMMGDFYHMGIEETSDLGALISAGEYLHHMHLATTTSRILPGQEERSYVDGFRGLKIIGFDKYCSYECKVRGDGDVEIPKSADFLRKQWEQATI